MKNKGSLSLEFILVIILVIIFCLFAFIPFGQQIANIIHESNRTVQVETDSVFNNYSSGSTSNPGGGIPGGSGNGGSGSNEPAHIHNRNIIVSVLPSTCETEGQITVKCSCGEDQQTFSLPMTSSCDINNVYVLDGNIETLNIDESTKIQITGNYKINKLIGSGDLCFEFNDPSYELTVGESESTAIPKGYGISTKFYDGATTKVPIFDSYDGWLDSNFELAKNVIISQTGASFNNLYGTGTLSRDSGGNYEVINGLVKTSGINSITYNGDWTYTVNASKDATRVEVELVFDYAEKGNSVEYYADTGLPFFEINSKVNVSDYNDNAYSSYVVSFLPNGNETTANLYVFNPNNPLNEYRVINIEFK